MKPASFSMNGRWPKALSLAAAYFVTAVLTLALTRVGGGVAIVWPAGAVLFAGLVTAPQRRWPMLVFATLPAGIVASIWFGFGHGVAVPLALVSIVEATGAAWLLKR